MGSRAKPQRIQLSRAKGWRMPPNTVKVDRTTPWGNPFIVRQHGKQIECVYWYVLMLCGYRAVMDNMDAQQKALDALVAEKKAGYPSLRGKNLACWCRIGTPCHADHLLEMVNDRRRKVDIDKVLARYGYEFQFGKGPVRISATA